MSTAGNQNSSMLATDLSYRHRSAGNMTVLADEQNQIAGNDGQYEANQVTSHVNFSVDHQSKSAENNNRMFESRTKRHCSFSVDEKQVGCKQRRNSDRFGTVAVGFRKRGRGGRHYQPDHKIVLPTKFLLGGSITDPLNLNSLCDEAINRSLNANTPVSSPLPVPVHKLEVPVHVPTNVTDPLHLNDEESEDEKDTTDSSVLRTLFKKRRKRNRRKTKQVEAAAEAHVEADEHLLLKPLQITADAKSEERSGRQSREIDDSKAKRVVDHIVSPVIPQMSPKWKWRRTVSECRTDPVAENRAIEPDGKPTPDKNVLGRHKRRSASQHQQQDQMMKFRKRNERYLKGSFNHHVISRNVMGYYEDPRLSCFTSEMFTGNDVLDIGCNVGHLTLSIARDLCPHRIVGIDVDHRMVNAAKKNLRNFVGMPMIDRFPRSNYAKYGPLVAPVLRLPNDSDIKFPNNVEFYQANYVPMSDDDITCNKEQYDVIVALNVTKWIHLNYGDVGLKRTFRKFYHQLRFGGLLVLEVQPWKAYRKRKKLTPKVYETYKSIQLHPEQFQGFLLSKHVGFASCSRLDSTSRQKRLKRPLYVYYKSMATSVELSSKHCFQHDAKLMVKADPGLMHLTDENLRTLLHYTPDLHSVSSTSSSCWQTPQFRLGGGSASCSTTPCCSTNCRNTPNVHDDSSVDDFTASALSSSHCAATADSSALPSTECQSGHVHTTSTLVLQNDRQQPTEDSSSDYMKNPHENTDVK